MWWSLRLGRWTATTVQKTTQKQNVKIAIFCYLNSKKVNLFKFGTVFRVPIGYYAVHVWDRRNAFQYWLKNVQLKVISMSPLFAIRMSVKKQWICFSPVKIVTSLGEFCVAYLSKFEELIKLCQKHGMIIESRNCLKCNERIHIDFNQKQFRCDQRCEVGNDEFSTDST